NGHNNWHSPRWNDFRRAFNAPHRYHYRGGHYHRPNGWYYQRWSIGAFLPNLFWSDDYWIDNADYYGLDDAPPGTTWVRYGDDALLIDRYTGEIIRVEYGIFY
ncbi:MAG TPA: RcnB family protein, partial [Pirellulales bacterium]